MRTTSAAMFGLVLGRPGRRSDRLWGTKVAECPFDPGPNYFSDSTDNVWVDGDDRLHLRSNFEQSRPTCVGTRDRWTSAEVYLLDSLGHGTYTVQLESPVDDLDPVAVFSPFIYERLNSEFDIEFSQALVPSPNNAQYLVQPFSRPGNRVTFRGLDTVRCSAP